MSRQFAAIEKPMGHGLSRNAVMKNNKGYLLAFLAIVLAVVSLSGCATGPLRYKTLGRYSYATVELTRCVHPVLKPVALVTGIPVDVVIIAGDTVFVPVSSLYFATLFGIFGPCPTVVKENPALLVFLPVVFPVNFTVGMVLFPYLQTYADPMESGLFYDDEDAFYGLEGTWFPWTRDPSDSP